MPKLKDGFFEKWSNQTAYVIGYFLADGDMSVNKRGSHYIGFTSTDRELLIKIRKLIGTKQKIGDKKLYSSNQKRAYRIQIGSKKYFNDVCKLGFNKGQGLVKLELIPAIYFRHFLRGYFDGDGNVSFGKYKSKSGPKTILLTRFAAGNKKLLESLLFNMRRNMPITGGSIYKNSRGYHLSFSINDSLLLFYQLYTKVPFAQRLERKYNIFSKAIRYWRGRSSAGLERLPVTQEVAGSNPVAPVQISSGPPVFYF